MGIQLNTGFSLKSKAFLDERDSFESLSAMKNYSETNLPDGFITYNKEDGLYYVYNSANDIDVNLGRWREYSGGSTVIKKTDIKTTLDENSTNDDVCGGKAIFDAIKKNCIGKETVLYDGNIATNTTYTLADDVNNYDFIVICHGYMGHSGIQSVTLNKTEISKITDTAHIFKVIDGDQYTGGYFNNDKLIIHYYNRQNIYSIVGYKFGEVTVQNTITNPLQPISYSLDEQLTGGTWIDGKPLYKRTFVTTAPSSVNTITNIVTLDAAIEPVNMYGFLMRDNGGRMPLLMYINDSQTGNISIWNRRNNDGNHIGMITGGSDNLNKPVYVTVEYTKTTDV